MEAPLPLLASRTAEQAELAGRRSQAELGNEETSRISAKRISFLLTWDSPCLHNIMTWRPHGRKTPAAIRGMAQIGSTEGRWLCIASNGPRIVLLPLPRGDGWGEGVVCCGKISTAETCTEQLTMLMTLLGLLWLLLLLAALLRWLDPTCCERMFRLVRRPVLVPVSRSAQRFLSSANPWRFYSIMAPPGPEPTQCRRSRPFRRF